MTLATNPDPAGNPGTSLPASASAAPTPAAILPVAGGFPMTEARESELLHHVPTLRTAAEMDGFRAQMTAQGETPTAAIYAALLKQSERMK